MKKNGCLRVLIKVFALCISKNGTVHNFKMYNGKEPVEAKRTGGLSMINKNIEGSINDSKFNPIFLMTFK